MVQILEPEQNPLMSFLTGLSRGGPSALTEFLKGKRQEEQLEAESKALGLSSDIRSPELRKIAAQSKYKKEEPKKGKLTEEEKENLKNRAMSAGLDENKAMEWVNACETDTTGGRTEKSKSWMR